MKRILVAVILVALLATEISGQSKPTAEAYFPQLVAGGGYRTVLVINNPTGRTRRVSVDWMSPQGTPIGLMMSHYGVSWGFQVVLPAGASVTETLSSPDGLKVGSLEFTQDVNSFGVIETEISITIQRIGIDGRAVDASKKLAPIEAARRAALYGSEFLGLAFSNPNDAPVTVTFTRKSGRMVTLTLPPHGQMARFASELLGNFAGGDELVELSASAPVVLLPLQMVLDPTDRLDKYQAREVARAKER